MTRGSAPNATWALAPMIVTRHWLFLAWRCCRAATGKQERRRQGAWPRRDFCEDQVPRFLRALLQKGFHCKYLRLVALVLVQVASSWRCLAIHSVLLELLHREGEASHLHSVVETTAEEEKDRKLLVAMPNSRCRCKRAPKRRVRCVAMCLPVFANLCRFFQ